MQIGVSINDIAKDKIDEIKQNRKKRKDEDSIEYIYACMESGFPRNLKLTYTMIRKRLNQYVSSAYWVGEADKTITALGTTEAKKSIMELQEYHLQNCHESGTPYPAEIFLRDVVVEPGTIAEEVVFYEADFLSDEAMERNKNETEESLQWMVDTCFPEGPKKPKNKPKI